MYRARMRILLLLALPLSFLATACGSKADPAACIDKRDIGACRALCESSDMQNKRFCYAERAFQMADCVDKNASCDEACKNWTSIKSMLDMGDATADDDYASFLGAKIDAVAAKCGGAAGAAPAPAGGDAPAGGETPPPAPAGGETPPATP